MSAAFTPGPWVAAGGPSSIVGWPVVRQGVGRSICSVSYLPRDADLAVYAESEANARLIAAAPELYEALEVARGEIARVHQLRSALPQIDAALAKARGEQ